MASAVRVGIIGDLGGSKSTHTATDGTLTWLAGEYLRAYGPAPCVLPVVGRDVPAGRASAALSKVETVELDGGLPAACRRP